MATPSLALIVDDEAHVRTFVSLIMKEIGVETSLLAADAEEAFRIYEARKPELVMIDIHLPGGASGLELLKRIRAVDTDTYTIILTCEASSSTVMAAVNAGADGFIRKDTPKAGIVRQIQEVLADPEE
ncbi:MAG TPA: response regulator [Opitutaceae bacterium]|nr:response regulator [Opitutaceae bacterium]